jgi:hypothetical protein
MGIQTTAGGGFIATGEGVNLVALLSLEGRIKLEAKGLKGSINATAIAMRRFGITGKATKKNREIVLSRIEEEKARYRELVARENALHQ